MRQWVRHAAVSATAALGVSVMVLAGCVSKPPAQPEPPKPVATARASAESHEGASGGAQAAAVDTADTGSAASGSGAGSAGPRSASAPPHTSEERRAVLDERLNQSLSAFDAKLRSEQQRVAKERDARQTAVLTVASSDNEAGSSAAARMARAGGGEDEGSGESKSSDRKHGGSRSTHSGDLKSDKVGGGASASGNGAVANEVPDGNDDDVVARRLRKAAEQETDPELKDKLWKEYVEYKKNTQGK
jgi:hypothetical protein